MSNDEFYALLPCFLLGLFCGIAAYFKGFIDDINHKPSLRAALGNAFSSAVLSIIVFAFLDSWSLSFMTKLSIASLVAFLGLDRALDYLYKIKKLK